MFSKKILGLVGLLFIGTQVKADIGDCGGAVNLVDGCVGNGSYCKGGNKIYEKGEKEGACNVAVINEVLFFNKSGVKVELSDINVTEPGAELKMYYCDSNSCVETEGYVKNGNGNFFIKSDSGASLATSVSVDTANDCAGSVGKLVRVTDATAEPPSTDIYLCLTEDKSVQLNDDSEGSYLVSSLTDLGLTEKDSQKYVITKIKDEEILLLNKLYTTGCYIESDESIMHTIDHFCEEGECEYYACTEGECTSESGVCTRNTTPPPPTCDPTKTVSEDNCSKQGYYLKDSKLYYCDNVECVDQSTTNQESGETTHPTGYYVDAASIDNTNYIECTGGATCRAMTVNSVECSTDGLVYKDGDNIRLCLDRGIVNGVNDSPISIILNGENAVEGDYFIKVSTSGNIFKGGDIDGNKYTIITVTSGSVVKYSFDFNNNTEDNKLFRYAGDNYEVLTKSTPAEQQIREEQQNVCADVNDLYEFGSICSDGKGTGNYEFKDYRNRRPIGQSN